MLGPSSSALAMNEEARRAWCWEIEEGMERKY
jgi:hypothetical protein